MQFIAALIPYKVTWGAAITSFGGDGVCESSNRHAGGQPGAGWSYRHFAGDMEHRLLEHLFRRLNFVPRQFASQLQFFAIHYYTAPSADKIQPIAEITESFLGAI